MDDIKVTFDSTEDIKTSIDTGSVQYGQLVIGTTTTGEAGTKAVVTNSGSSAHAILNFTIPKGKDGLDGEDGESGVYIGEDEPTDANVWIDPNGEADIIPTKTSQLENDSGFLTEHQDLSNYALKSEIPDTSNYALKSEIPDVSEYALKSEIPDVSEYALKSEIPDTSNFITKNVDDLSNYYNKNSIDEMIGDIESLLGGI